MGDVENSFMILFAYGNDSYLLREKVAGWIAQYKAKNKNGFNIFFYTPKTFDIHEFKRSLLSVGMFAEKKLAVLEGFADSSHASALLSFMQDAAIKEKTDTFLIFTEYLEPTGDKRAAEKKEASFAQNKLVSFLVKSAYKTEQLQTPHGTKLREWARKEFQKRNTRADARAIEALIAAVPANLWFLSSEIEKLSLYTPSVSADDVALLVRRSISTDIFKTIDALSGRNKAAALSMLHEHLRSGNTPLSLLAMLSFQFRNIYMAKKLGASPFPKILSLHPFVQQKARAQSRNFSLSEIERAYQKLFETDVAIKTGDMDGETALDVFVAGAL